MTVYIPQEPKPNRQNWVPDFSSALQYGEIAFVFESHEKVYAIPAPSLFKARRLLENFNYKEDYILIHTAGDPMAQIVVDMVLRELDPEYINFLYWDRKREPDGTRKTGAGFYVPKTLKLKGV